MVKLKARKAEGKCEICWQRITEQSKQVRRTMWFQGKQYHVECWEGRYKKVKRAEQKLARTKKSF